MSSGHGELNDGLDRRRVPLPPAGEQFVVTDFASVEERFASLRLAMPSVAFVLPRNFESAPSQDRWIYEAITPSLSIIARQAGLDLAVPGQTPPRTINEYSAEVVAAAVHIGALILSDATATALVQYFVHLAKYMKQRLDSAKSAEATIVQELIVSRNGKSKRVIYRGSIDGLPQIVEIAKQVLRNE